MRTIKKQIRRSPTAIDIELSNALKEQVENVGFANVTIKDLIAKANIVPSSFYKRFPNIESFMDYFVQGYDFWFMNLAELHNTGNIRTDYKKMMQGLADSLYKSKIMQKLLLWELSSDNSTTRRTAQKREEDCKDLIELIDSLFLHHHVEDIRTITSILISGIYYIILHKDRSTFCGIDFNTNEGKEKLDSALGLLTTIIFDMIETDKNTPEYIERLATEKANKIAVAKMADASLEKAKEMKEDGLLALEDIARYTNIPVSIIESL